MIHAIAIAIIVQVSNIARVPDADLGRAQQEVTRLYHDTGVDVTWTTPDTRDAPRPSVRVVLVSYETGELKRQPKAVMGAALVTEQGTSVAYIFYRQVEAQARQYDVSTALVLGCAIAHEIAHLLLPDRQHAPAGLMRACWSRDDFHRADRSELRFSTEQAALIRARVALQPLVEHESRHRAGQ